MHTVWKGAISFGLVHVPIKMYSATEDKDIALKYVHRECGSPLNQLRNCPACQREVEWEQVSRGYEYEKHKFVLFEKEELERLMPETNKEIRIMHFVDPSEIDPVYYHKTYYLGPGDIGANAYSLLVKAMRQSGKIAIGQIAIRSKKSLAVIRIVDDCLALETIFYPDEIRPVQLVPNVPVDPSINEKELQMAQMLIGQLTSPFDPTLYQDDYRVNLIDAIQRKIAGEDIRIAPATAPQTGIMDLMSALQASLEALKPVESAMEPTAKKPKSRSKRQVKSETIASTEESAS
ncbi:non-homologous end joining protein Ku [Paenibacillus sp. UNC451MF]|uniref:non-homologous end joining protein Ku n=1 Tax=Paenibacillus sp. UNC451MF TaxID=1449063 RepID=UPI00048D9B21|nr:Ku protein [Paenibacillus sp. UNC451MF]